MHFAWMQNTAADFLSGRELSPKKRQTKTGKRHHRPLQVNLQSSDVADQEQSLFLPDKRIKTEEEFLLQKELARQNARDGETRTVKLTIKEMAPKRL